jgi:hypothetical protein
MTIYPFSTALVVHSSSARGGDSVIISPQKRPNLLFPALQKMTLTCSYPCGLTYGLNYVRV